ncbi:MAG TPA: hypothetical protein DCZ94_07835 [Lentisphaeria bacterium]|nr:MAG: hypothetical protein A2X48_24235 [Lentisphaerae bacterium GWF2_49_21]HBC86847.1 hypothetical protein [Lentisphaeria bacterium]
MLIKCNSCGHENQLGAIFCRSCGGKLDVETMRPKVEDKASSFNVFGLIRNLVGFAIFIGVVGILVMMFYPDDLSAYPSLSDPDVIKAAEAKYEIMLKKAEQGYGDESYTFTAQEATYLYNKMFVAKPTATDAAAYSVEKLIFNIDAVGFIHVILKTKMMGSVPTTFEIAGTVKNSDTKTPDQISVSFKATEHKMGHMPIMFAEKQVLEKFDPATTGGKIPVILKAISKIEVDGKNFVVKF